MLLCSVAQKQEKLCAICPTTHGVFVLLTFYFFLAQLLVHILALYIEIHRLYTATMSPDGMEESVTSNCFPVDQKEDVAVTWPFVFALQFFTITINQYGDFSTFLKHEKCFFPNSKGLHEGKKKCKKMHPNPANEKINR